MKTFYTLFNKNGEIPKETFEEIKNSLVNDLAKNNLKLALNEVLKVIESKSGIHILEFGNVEIVGVFLSNPNARNYKFSNIEFENKEVYKMDFFQKLNLFNT